MQIHVYLYLTLSMESWLALMTLCFVKGFVMFNFHRAVSLFKRYSVNMCDCHKCYKRLITYLLTYYNNKKKKKIYNAHIVKH